MMEKRQIPDVQTTREILTVLHTADQKTKLAVFLEMFHPGLSRAQKRDIIGSLRK